MSHSCDHLPLEKQLVKDDKETNTLRCHTHGIILTLLGNKMDEVIVKVRSNCADIMAIMEVWQIVPELCPIENFELFHLLRTN